MATLNRKKPDYRDARAAREGRQRGSGGSRRQLPGDMRQRTVYLRVELDDALVRLADEFGTSYSAALAACADLARAREVLKRRQDALAAAPPLNGAPVG